MTKVFRVGAKTAESGGSDSRRESRMQLEVGHHQVVLPCDNAIVGDTSGKPLYRSSDRDYRKCFPGR